MKRYHPFLVTLHWILAIVIAAWLLMGSNVLSEMPNSDPEKINSLKVHMAVGIGILVFMLVRLVVRLRSQKLAPVNTNTVAINKASTLGHYALYTVAIMMSVSGIVTAQIAGLGDIVFFGSGVPLPETFEGIVPLVAHEVLSVILMLLVAGHVLAALYHQFALKEKLFARVWFGNRQ
ncbi:cytochrome b/b6 domain-containing protein [Candidatus Thioglobus autotrophicus]|uniref:cytochrome b n=1 Tax=Candidatus Thioglobus autotrophicus TaxID=1705394 RepID=UPI00299E9249|nr:cytochrome b/b6 domain-containing protein [Candidatus Thioglobus autotrophicus]WPE16468.1 cytochrome b/b6 domain-containing protein [Candidatus Thioglobus autotrophicus]